MSIETKTSPLADKKYRMRFNKALREKGVPAKACGACFTVKGREAFHADSGKRDGRSGQCMLCARRRAQSWYQRNPEHAAESRKSWYEANRPQQIEAARKWASDNPERKRISARKWVRANPEQVAEHHRRYRARKAAATVTPFTPADLRADWEEHDLYGCFYCGGPTEPLNIDHFYPLNPADEDAAPGPHAVDNLVPACETCNKSKNNRDPWAFLSDALAARGVDLDACLAVFDVE